jgi:hypothetical protein
VEYQLHEQQGLSPPPALVNSSSDDEEESDGEWTTFDKWEPVPTSPQAEGAAVELVPEAGAEPPAPGLSVEVPVGTVEAPAGAMEVPPALKEEEAELLQFEVGGASSCAPLTSRGSRTPVPFFCCQGGRRVVPALAPIKALKLMTSATTGRCSERVPRASASATAVGEPSRATTAAIWPQ